MNARFTNSYGGLPSITSSRVNRKSPRPQKSAKNGGKLNDLGRVYKENRELTFRIYKSYKESTSAGSHKGAASFFHEN